MARPQWESIVAQAPRKELIQTKIEQTNMVAINGKEYVYLYSAPNTISKLKRMYFGTELEGSSGEHSFYLLFTQGLGSILFARYNATNSIIFNQFHFQNEAGIIAERPTTKEMQLDAFLQTEFDDVIGLKLNYNNDKNVVHTKMRLYDLVYIQEEVR